MTPRERLLTVLRGGVPDVVPWFADLSNWLYARRRQRFVPSPDKDFDLDMIDLYREVGAGAYIELGGIVRTGYTDGTVGERQHIDGDTFTWTIETPHGTLTEVRRYNTTSWSWDITRRMVRSVEDLPVIRYAMERRTFTADNDRYRRLVDACGDHGVPFAAGVPYSGLGFFVSRFMGIENTIYALYDHPEEMAATIRLINKVNLAAIECLAASPAEVVITSDNLSSDVQTPDLFREHSAWYYRRTADILHAAGKVFATHVDGRVRGLLPVLYECGVDLADALTPAPTGDMEPLEMRKAAGPGMILSGGVSPVFWSPSVSDRDFTAHVRQWLELRHESPRLIMSDGDQTPPGTPLDRIRLMRDLVEEHGRY